MSKRMPPIEKRFKPGVSGNPGGKRKLPDDIKEARKLNQLELERIVNRYLWLDRAALQERIKDPATPMMEIMIASIIAQAAQKGDQQRMEFILCRLIGKVQDKIEVTMPTPFIISKLNGEQIVMGVKGKETDDQAI